MTFDYEKFFTMSADLLCIANTDGYFKRVNSAWQNVLGYESDFLLTRPFLEFVHPDDIQATVAEVNRLRDGNKTVSFTNRYRCKDGTYKWLQWTSVPDLSGQLYAVARDITETREFEAKVLSANVNLENRVQERTRALLKSNDELEQFAQIASHDLQEPLRTIQLYTGVLLEHVPAHLIDDEARVAASYIGESVVRVRKLIQALFEYSRFGKLEMSAEEVSLNDCLDEASGLLEKLIVEKKAVLTIGKLPRVMGYRSMLVRVFQNLIQNSLNYAGEQAPHICVSAGQEQGQEVVTFQDNGVGIDPQYHQAVFKPFRRLTSDRSHAGCGLGLAICEKAMANHGGSIWIEPKDKPGTCFKLKFGAIGSSLL